MTISTWRPSRPDTRGRPAAPALIRWQDVPVETVSIPGWTTEYVIAEGAEARIFRVYRDADPDRRPFAVKVLRTVPDSENRHSYEERARVLREVITIRALSEAGCPNIPHVVAFSVGNSSGAPPWYIMPYYGGGSMWTDDGDGGLWAERYRGNVDRVLEIAESLAMTLAFMHDGQRRSTHGNVAVGNVLFAAHGSAPVLGGFGSATLEQSDIGLGSSHDSHLTSWLPPELEGTTGRRATPAADVFMLGGLMYEALTGGRVLPPPSSWAAQSIHERTEYALTRESSDPRLEAVATLLRGMLVRSAKRRIAARHVAIACRSIRTGRTVAGSALKALLASPGA